MATKQILNSSTAPDGSQYVTLTDGAGNLVTTGGSSGITIGTTSITGGATTQVLFNLAGVVSSDSGFTYAGSGGQLQLNSNGILTSPASATWQYGAGNINGAPVAQTIKFQSALAGSATNQASANTTIIGSLGTGTGTNGDIIFQTGLKTTTGTVQATPTTALTIRGENGSAVFVAGSTSAPSIAVTGGLNSGIYFPATTVIGFVMGGTEFVRFGSTGFISNTTGYGIGTGVGNPDIDLTREAANVLAINSSLSGTVTNPASVRVYNVASSNLVNYERGLFDWGTTANTLTIGTQAAGTGTLRSVSAIGPWSFVSPPKFATAATGATTALLATANCPAITGTQPYVWMTVISSDGSTVYVPAWK